MTDPDCPLLQRIISNLQVAEENAESVLEQLLVVYTEASNTLSAIQADLQSAQSDYQESCG